MEDTQFLHHLQALALKLVIMMTAAKQHIEGERISRPAKMKGGKLRGELWSPNIIGRNYRPQRESQGGTHASPRMHWRQGHMRAVPFGPRAQPQYRPTWIEPVLVNSG